MITRNSVCDIPSAVEVTECQNLDRREGGRERRELRKKYQGKGGADLGARIPAAHRDHGSMVTR